MNPTNILASAVLVLVALVGVLLWRRAAAEHRALVASTEKAIEGLAVLVEELSRNMHERVLPAPGPGLSAEPASPPAPADLPELASDTDAHEDETTHVYARPTLLSRSRSSS